MQYIDVNLWPATVVVCIGVASLAALRLSMQLLRRAVRVRTRRALSRVLDESEAKTESTST